MRKIKILLCLACVASMAAAVSAPGSALASETLKWTYHTAPLTESAKVGFNGNLGFATVVGSVECAVHLDATLKPGHEGTVDNLSLKNSDCEGSGAYSGCDVLVESSVMNEPYTLSATKEALTISGNIFISRIYSIAKSCGVEEDEIFFSSIKATPDDPEKISELTLSGEGQVNAFGLELEAEAFGTLEPEEPKAYGIRSFKDWTSKLHWGYQGSSITKSKVVEISGTLGAPVETMWTPRSDCAVQGKATLEAGTGRAYVTELETGYCSNSGFFEPCDEVEGVDIELGALEAVTSKKLHVRDLSMQWQYQGAPAECQLSVTGIDMNATLEPGSTTTKSVVAGEYEIQPLNAVTEDSVLNLTLSPRVEMLE